ncbi:MAG: pyrroloquinoline-quinone synthase [Thermoleophilaceae bacterium]|jgi:pyrroloquinoline-quinone synthase|nr:pyrroloquinoline-quinone synthase [Thermoleophilaceae bacterium]
MDFWDRLDAAAKRWNVLRHPFYRRWSNGQLSPAELSLYAGQYAHAVAALATATRQAADSAPAHMADELADHAVEEESHVALWRQFGEAVDFDPADAPLPETADCVRTWADPRRGCVRTLVALYAIESAQPAISETKRAGLAQHYGIAGGPATSYFDTHVVLDRDHARSGRELISDELHEANADALVAEAERVLAANWRLLDGVERESAPLRR